MTNQSTSALKIIPDHPAKLSPSKNNINVNLTWDRCPKVSNPNEYLKLGFKNEKEMTDLIDHFAIDFARDVLEVEYKSHLKEFYLGDKLNIIRNKGNLPHVDFMFIDQQDKNILVECKNPTNAYAELSNAIGQLLSYYCIAKDNGLNIDRIAIVSSKYNDRIRRVIEEFKLPIEVYLLSHTNILKVCQAEKAR